MNPKDLIRRSWRSFRETQPFNALATSALRRLNFSGPKLDTLADHLPRMGRVTLPLPNGKTVRLRSYGDDLVANRIFWKQRYEPETTSVFFQLAERSHCTIDIGAHIGIYALMAARAQKDGWVYAFEPLPHIFKRLQENIRLNDLSRVEAYPMAVSDTVGKAEFHYEASPYLPSNSTLMKTSSAPMQSMSVDVTTLDHFAEFKGISHIDLIKMDTEGTEVQVLKGMTRTLQRDKPSIFCEVLEAAHNADALEALLAPYGYRYYRLEPGGPVLQKRITTHPVWWNYLFTTT